MNGCKYDLCDILIYKRGIDMQNHLPLREGRRHWVHRKLALVLEVLYPVTKKEITFFYYATTFVLYSIVFNVKPKTSKIHRTFDKPG